MYVRHSISVAANWVEEPLKQFVEDARVQLAVLLHPSGQALGQFGFVRSVDVMTACALSSATRGSTNSPKPTSRNILQLHSRSATLAGISNGIFAPTRTGRWRSTWPGSNGRAQSRSTATRSRL